MMPFLVIILVVSVFIFIYIILLTYLLALDPTAGSVGLRCVAGSSSEFLRNDAPTDKGTFVVMYSVGGGDKGLKSSYLRKIESSIEYDIYKYI